MRYLGSKSRHAKHIVPILMDGHNPENPYIEPFVGGGNMIQHVPAPIRIGSDVDADAIALLDGLANGWNPPDTLTEEEYRIIRNAPEAFPPPLVGFAKFSCSFGGKGWGGFARDKKGVDQTEHAQSRTLRKEAPRLKGCRFSVKTYTEVEYPNSATVYMDPPYAATTGYKSGNFDHAAFWDFCRIMSHHSRVFVSEYNAPADWMPIWQKPVPVSIDSNRMNGSPRIEKLFVWMGSNNVEWEKYL